MLPVSNVENFMRSTALDAATDHRAKEVLRFWFGDESVYGARRKEWFVKDPALDAEIRSRFLDLHAAAAGGELAPWQERAAECLALVIVLDQFSRNLFRGEARAFAADARALDAARHAIASGYDGAMLPAERLFLYLPFEHSESLEDQELSCELMKGFEPEQYRYALRHREIIQRFGRFPHRNDILGRQSTPAEIEFLRQPGSGF